MAKITSTIAVTIERDDDADQMGMSFTNVKTDPDPQGNSDWGLLFIASAFAEEGDEAIAEYNDGSRATMVV